MIFSLTRLSLATIVLLMAALLMLNGCSNCVNETPRSTPVASSPFLLLVTEPKDQSIVSETPISLSGRTATDAVVSINGITIAVDETGIFTTSVSLIPGPNTIDVVATGTDGQVMSTVIAVIYRP